MKWPTHTDYQDAIQNPEICFEQPELKAGEAAIDPLGLPRVMSGNFASVYEVATAKRRVAVRCFVRQVSGTQARYLRLSEHLGSLSLPWLVDFEFVQQGIRVHNDWFPIVMMHWVEGCPINNYVEEHLQDKEALHSLAKQFRVMVNDLRRHRIAHGDFQHGNIMVTPQGELRLVDYDGMFCPAFGTGRSPELGHANFQHPLRLADYYDESLDNFSALVIYTSLLALAAEPALWKEFHTGDNLLFTSNDFRNTHNSTLFERMRKSPDGEVQQLGAVLQRSSIGSVKAVPWFEETVVAAQSGALQQMVMATPGGGLAGASEQRQDGWWENSQEHTTFLKKPGGTRASPAAPAPAPAAREQTRPAPPVQPVPSTGSRAGSAQGTRPVPEPEMPIMHPSSIAPEEGGNGWAFKLKVAAAVLILIGIFWYALAASKAREVRAQEQQTEAVDGN